MRQLTFAALSGESGFERHGKPTRREAFLAEMDAVVRRAALCGEIAPH